MPRFSANVSTLFTELPLLERFAAAARCGFRAAEIQFPYTISKEQIAEVLARSNMELVLFNMPAGRLSDGDLGIACLPDRVQEFRDGVALAIDYAKALQCGRINCLAGKRSPKFSAAQCRETLIANFRFAADALAQAGLHLLTEPLNSVNHPSFFLTGSSEAFALMDEVGRKNFLLQYDFYHMRIMAEDIAATLTNHLPRIGHIQLADHPGRHEPGTGEIDFRALFDRLDRLGYAGWVGCEYVPSTTTEASFGWMKELASARA